MLSQAHFGETWSSSDGWLWSQTPYSLAVIFLELQCSLRLILPFFHPLCPFLRTDLHCGLTTLLTTSSSLLFSSHGHVIHQLSYTSNSIMEYSL